jgi:putative oxidoreductase
MNQQTHSPSLLNRIARVLLCLVFLNAVLGNLMGFGAMAGVIAAKGLPLAPPLLVSLMLWSPLGRGIYRQGWHLSP